MPTDGRSMEEKRVLSFPHIDIAPSKALIDEKISILLEGFEPNQAVTVRAQMPDYSGRVWTSWATFDADSQGAVSLSSQKPLSGTYDEVDPMGLFWSMGPDRRDKEVAPYLLQKTDLRPVTMTFTAEMDGEFITSAHLERLFVSPGVTRIPVRENGLVATLFRPVEGSRPPAIITVGGSEGGLREDLAALLASHGYAALALAYFGIEHLPENLVRIPLESFQSAIHWLQAQDDILGDKLAVIGGSRGGELALLLGATFPQIKAVVAVVGGGVMTTGISRRVADVVNGVPSWTHRGDPLPYLPCRFTLPFVVGYGWRWLLHRPISLSPFYLAAMKDEAALQRAAIPVERINGPVLLISGQDDRMWPSTALSQLAIDRLTKYNHPHPYKHLSYAGAGHVFGIPHLPTTVNWARHPVTDTVYTAGGNPRADALAQSDSWSQFLQFLPAAFEGDQ